MGRRAHRVGPRLATDAVTLIVDGELLRAYKGETVAAALMAAERRTFRVSLRFQKARSLFCGIGVCFDCLVQIDGRSGRRACQVFVSDRMEVETRGDRRRRS